MDFLSLNENIRFISDLSDLNLGKGCYSIYKYLGYNSIGEIGIRSFAENLKLLPNLRSLNLCKYIYKHYRE